jgi:dolichol-phosphate mannosyltransferase
MSNQTDNPPALRPQLLRPQPELVSIVVPVFNEAENIPTLVARLRDAMADVPFEIIFVEDGSDDGTAETIEKLAAEDACIRGLCLSRRFGHQYCLAAGLRYATGQVVVMMDGDLQHPPEVVPQLIDRWRAGFNIVQARRIDTEDASASRKRTSRLYYRLFRFLCGVPLEEGMADFCLLGRMVVDEINKVQEGQLFLRGLIAWMGYRRGVVEFTAPGRGAGRTKYGLGRMLHLAKSGILSFSSAPMRLGIGIGLVMSALSFLELIFVVVAKLGGWVEVPGWASTVGLLSLVFGVMFLLMGLQGEYLIRIYERVQRRPGFLVEREIGSRISRADHKATAEQQHGDDRHREHGA